MNEQQCQTVTDQQCTTVKEEACNTVFEEKCQTVTEQECTTVQVPVSRRSTFDKVVKKVQKNCFSVGMSNCHRPGLSDDVCAKMPRKSRGRMRDCR